MLSKMQLRLRIEHDIENEDTNRDTKQSENVFNYGLLEDITYDCCMGVEELMDMIFDENN